MDSNACGSISGHFKCIFVGERRYFETQVFNFQTENFSKRKIGNVLTGRKWQIPSGGTFFDLGFGIRFVVRFLGTISGDKQNTFEGLSQASIGTLILFPIESK